ncbi:phage structural protein [Alcaligenes sp. SDU_A2]|uniref:phage structural protein n=1 Tax=Alcaligenes sp. SDU_A2 TaxID=3136634 RepID=UPI00311F7DC8
MATNVKTYDPKQVKIVVGAHTVSGVSESSFLSIEPKGEGVASVVGVYGDVTRTLSHDPRHTVKITLQPTSRSNAVLSDLCNADRLSGGNGAFPILVTDLRGGTLFAGTAWMVKQAAATFANTPTNKEWVLEAVGAFTHGGGGD